MKRKPLKNELLKKKKSFQSRMDKLYELELILEKMRSLHDRWREAGIVVEGYFWICDKPEVCLIIGLVENLPSPMKIVKGMISDCKSMFDVKLTDVNLGDVTLRNWEGVYIYIGFSLSCKVEEVNIEKKIVDVGDRIVKCGDTAFSREQLNEYFKGE